MFSRKDPTHRRGRWFYRNRKNFKSKAGKTSGFRRKNVVETEDGLRLLADAAGQPKIIDGKVTVLEIYEVNGNVDNTTGNIRFNGKVIVKGM